jgi:chemotaxis protein histidine kinase CheA
MVKIDGDLFAIPLEMVNETKRISNTQIKKVKNRDVINDRESTIPLIDSYDFLNFKKRENDSSSSEDALKASQKVDREFIKGILTLNEKLVIVIDTEKLFDNFNLEMALD